LSELAYQSLVSLSYVGSRSDVVVVVVKHREHHHACRGITKAYASTKSLGMAAFCGPFQHSTNVRCIMRCALMIVGVGIGGRFTLISGTCLLRHTPPLKSRTNRSAPAKRPPPHQARHPWMYNKGCLIVTLACALPRCSIAHLFMTLQVIECA
jgi:hypothetical protein